MFFIESIFKLIAPYECMRCGMQGTLICEKCLEKAIKKAPGGCFRCRQKLSKGKICDDCRQESSIDQLWVAARYDGAIRILIRKLKFERAKSATNPLAKLLKGALPDPDDEFQITYVPTATSRVRERGYDHAKQLAAEYAGLQGRKIQNLLSRHGQARQVGASRSKRQEQLKTAFSVKKGQRVAGSNILLIDDVVTTGATLEAATKALKKAGAKSVSALIVAQK